MHDGIWLKRVLVPFWVVDLIWFLVILIFASMDVGLYNEESGIDVIEAAVLLAMSSISMILDVTAIVLLARHKLTPVTYLVFQCVKTAFWTYPFIVDIVLSAHHYKTGLSFLFTVVLFCTSVGQLAYGSITLDRKRKGKLPHRGQYTGVEGGHLAAGYETPPRGSYAAYNPYGAPPNPFRDPSPARGPSPAASAPTQQPTAMHPAFRPSGEANEYYDPSSVGDRSYEMQGTAYRDQ
ncbi:hypothetical protein LTR85_002226 [Meristemomyces frigidus]|nr:hypothetical protein LTR85_002226 [Meristemomyces frigidus]